VEVAADAVWALFAAQLLRAEPIVIAHACKASGITPNELREARQRRRDGGVAVLRRQRPQRAARTAGPAPVPLSPPSSRACGSVFCRFAAVAQETTCSSITDMVTSYSR
jgi:hypothetical protein